MTMITPSYLGETIEYSSLHACRSTLEDPTPPERIDHVVTWNPQALPCHARAKSTLRPCRNAAMRGQQVCRLHGGRSPKALIKAAERIAAERSIKILEAEGRPVPVTNPTEALMALAGEVLTVKDILSEHVAKLTQLRYESEGGGEQLRGEIQAYERALDRSVHVLTQLSKLGLEERQTKIKEDQSRLVAAVFLAVFADPDLGLSIDAQERAKDISNRHLKVITAPPSENAITRLSG